MLLDFIVVPWLYLGNSQVSVYRTIGPTLVSVYRKATQHCISPHWRVMKILSSFWWNMRPRSMFKHRYELENKRIYHEFVDRIDNSVTRVTVWHHAAPPERQICLS